MITIRKDEYVFEVDVEKTIDYYRSHSCCECDRCQNFYAQIQGKFPKLEAFLSEFGIDISKPDETLPVERDGMIDYISVDYTVCGKVTVMGQYEIDLHDTLFFNIVITDGSASPNEQTGDHFTISVENMVLPWVLDKPLDEKPEKRKRKHDGKAVRVYKSSSTGPKGIFAFFERTKKKLSRKQRPTEPPTRSWDEIIEGMYEKDLDAFCDEVVSTVYSKDRTMRYVILKEKTGVFTWQLEAIYPFDRDEWKYIHSDKDLPAMWEPFPGVMSRSLFANEEELLEELKAEPEFKMYF